MPASWLQLSIKATPAALDVISNFLIERGSPGVVLERDEIRAFFARPARRSALEKDIQRFLQGIKGVYPDMSERPLRWTILKDKKWDQSWRRFFCPQKVGHRFWVTPPWVAVPASTDRKVITIEPGMAFGTGTHPTTRCCLELLEDAIASLREDKVTALDFGTGSGILAIALAKMGAAEVWAVDNDPTALKAAELNVRHNRAMEAVRLSNWPLDRIPKSFTIVVANLTAETILDLAGALQEKVALGGYLILSGILRPRAEEVRRPFSSGSFVLSRQKNQKEWATLLLKRKG